MANDSTNPGAAPSPTPARQRTTRLAPSPTGALHLGNARTFILNWALARQQGWRIVLRIEDLDGPRIKAESIDGIQQTLVWLGLDWDQGPLIQSHELEPAREAMRILAAKGGGKAAYPSELSRTEIEAAASAPQAGSGEVRFPSSLRPADAGRARGFDREDLNWRFLTPPGLVEFEDLIAGPQRLDPAESIGDFVIWTKRGTPAYQLAVVVDDARQGVTDVIRGDDLLDSAARQLRLYESLNLGPPPRYAHLPLVIGPDGRRLAKRHGDTRVDHYRQLGIDPRAIVAWVARTCGLDAGDRLSIDELARALRVDMIPRSPITWTPEDDAWLCSQTDRHLPSSP